ncbi:winged helix DNA-binding protein [Halovivax gelatinilyticus]|uniref:winged helix DNA-binding protein n=1 Tax=Halovivax gelatinilyticus TaxID=2961597 RepID=UPI0020CA90D8|nr:winged helix DNA-binding protein [Halovivax gelatinilyticus]
MATLQQVIDDLDPKSIDMLRAISERGNEATTPEIRDRTGLSNGQVAYRREKLREYGFLSVRTGDPDGSRTPPKVHSFTTSARSHIEAGLFERYDPPVTSDVEQLSTQTNHLRDRIDDLERVVDDLGEQIEQVNRDLAYQLGEPAEIREATDGETIATTVSAIRSDVAELRDELDELDERKKDKGGIFR